MARINSSINSGINSNINYNINNETQPLNNRVDDYVTIQAVEPIFPHASLKEESKFIIRVVYKDKYYTLTLSLLVAMLYFFTFFVLFIKNSIYNTLAIIAAILLYMHQINKLEIIFNLLITIFIIAIAVNNLGLIKNDFLKLCNDFKGNDTSINCNTITTRCFNNYIDFRFNISNLNNTFSCR